MWSRPDLSSAGSKEQLPRRRSLCRERQAASPGSPLPELLEDHPVGEALTADPNALKDTIAAQLVQHQVGIQFASLEKKTHAHMWSCFCA